MINLLDLDANALLAFFAKIGEKPFRAKQLLRWLHVYLENDFEQMSDLAKSLRAKLQQEACIVAPAIISDKTASDGTRKFLFDVGKANAIESVFIPEGDRGTLCISTQAGCALDCAFCSTGKQGFNRNLSVAEIIGQLWQVKKALSDFPKNAIANSHERIISNVVLMGMGEPLANFESVVSALSLMLDDRAYGLSRRRVTLSTSGIVPAMDKLRN